MAPREYFAPKVVKIAGSYAQAASRAAGAQVVDMVGPSVHDGDDVHRMHELDRDAPLAGGAPAIAPLLADVTVPEE